MTRTGSLILAALAVLTAQGCGGDDVVGPRPPVDIVFATVLQGYYGTCADCDSSATEVVLLADEGSWRSFWERSVTEFATAPPPVVDFRHEVVLALLDKVESQATWIEIASVRRESDRIVVRATRTAVCWDPWLHWLAGDDWRPYHIVRINRRVAPVDLHVTDVGCP